MRARAARAQPHTRLELSGLRSLSCGRQRRRWRNRRRALRVELQDVPAVDPEPEERLLRLAVLAEHRIAGRAFERLVEVREVGAQLLARLRAAVVEHALEDAGRVERVRLEEAGRAPVRAAEVVDELLRRRPLGGREEDVDEDAALHVPGDAGPLVDQVW